MKLTTLGGSAAGVGTGQGCSSYLVQTNTSSLALDMGPNTLLELRNHIDFRLLDGIVISHLHVDHILDLVALRFTLSYNPLPAPQKLPLHLPPDGIDMLERIANAFDGPGAGLEWFTNVFDIAEYDPAGTVTIGDVTCRFHPTVHFIPCWAIRVDENTGTGGLLFTADTGPSSVLRDFGQGVRVLLSESAGTESNDQPFEQRGHLTPSEAGALASALGVETLVLTHLWEENDPAKSVQHASRTYQGTILRAIPGLEVSWTP